MTYRLKWSADTEGDWFDAEPPAFLAVEAARQWAIEHYRGEDDFGAGAYARIVDEEEVTVLEDFLPLPSGRSRDDCHAVGRSREVAR